MGAFTLALAQPNTQYTREDLSFVEELARRASISLENARLFEEAQKAVGSRDEFVSIAAHELRTPLTSIALQSSNLVHAVNKPDGVLIPVEKVRPSVEILDRQVSRLTVLVEALLDLSRSVSRPAGLVTEKLDLRTLIDDVALRFREQAREAGCTLAIEGAKSCTGRWDRTRLEQLLTNLLSNAIFERFERAVPSSSHFGGLGLGLWIVKQIVEACGGAVQVDSEPSRGAEFVVMLPRGM